MTTKMLLHPEKGIRCQLNFRLQTAEQLQKEAELLVADVKSVYDRVGSVAAGQASFAAVVKPLLDLESEQETRAAALTIPSMVATDQAVRDASTAAEKQLEELHVEMAMRKDVFDNVAAFSKTEEASSLEPELKRYLEKRIVEGRRNGLHLPEETRERLKTIKKRMSELGVSFQKNLNEDTTHLFFQRDELDGVPEDLIKTLERDESDRLKVTMKYPHFFPVTRKCRVPNTRHLMEKTFLCRCIKENTAILEELVELRQQQADLLGYKNHAAYVTELRMAKSPETVATFLTQLADKLAGLAREEMEVMLKLKEEETSQLGIPFNGKLDYWDMRYYSNMVEEKHYAVDQEKLKEYFPMEVVTEGLMAIYQQLLGLKFTRLVEGADQLVWHEDVELWQVEDTATGEQLGYFLLDLYPRDGKFGHACEVHLQQGCLDPEGKRQKTVAAMLCNFSKYTADKPSLLDHKEVETYFHEFGHVMHVLCSRAKTSRFFGTSVERDFVEAPSQMLENWVWQEESLRLMSKHYKDGSPLPKEMLDKLIASKNANAGTLNLRQIFLATFDQRIHTRAKADTAALVGETYREIIGVEPIEGTNFAASFGHMVGYDAQYYGYLWSEVYSQDMFDSRFAAEGILNSKTGADYRRCILEKGGSLDGMDMLIDFLGREPSQEPFLRSKGLSSQA